MSDDELEATLRRYKASDPPDALRACALGARRPELVPVTGLDWCLLGATAAAVLIAVVSAGSPSLPAVSEAEAARQVEVQALAAAIGGDDAVRYAEMLVPLPPLTMPAWEE